MTRGHWRQLDGWKARAVGLLREAFPADAAELPIYLADAAELPPEFRCEGLGGYTSPVCDLALQPYVSDWRGRGFGCIVFPDRQDEHLLWGTIVHEFIHYCDYLATASRSGQLALLRSPIDSMAPADKSACEDGVVAVTISDGARPDVPWQAHELLFIWGCCHAAYRAWALADLTSAYQLINFGGARYGLSDKLDYLRAAGDDPHMLAELPLTEVLAIVPPVAMCSLWERDVSSFFERQNNGK